MLTTLAEILDALRAKEVEALARFSNIRHQGMIGDMYEGLTREMLTRSLFERADLRVVTGKVRMADGSFSKQMDAMLVRGDGERMPYSDHYVYGSEDVIAAVEVKKTLYGDALEDAYGNLRSLHHGDYLKHIPLGRFQFVFRKVAQMEIPGDGDMTRLSWAKEMLAHVVMWDVTMPVRIVFGYDGYTSEYTLREGFVDYLDRVFQSGDMRGFGPASFPSLIICGSSSLVKLNGMPYSAQVEGTNEWLLYASSSTRPVVLLLEVIWTRLHSMGLIGQELFGDDMEIEQFNPLLYATPANEQDRAGWRYRYELLSKEALARTRSTLPWEPTRLTNKEAVLLSHLCRVLELNTRSSAFWSDWKADSENDIQATMAKFRLAGLAAIDENGVLRLLTENCQVAVIPNVGWIAAENSTGRMTRWVIEQMKRDK